jgi:hypothetical protein
MKILSIYRTICSLGKYPSPCLLQLSNSGNLELLVLEAVSTELLSRRVPLCNPLRSPHPSVYKASANGSPYLGTVSLDKDYRSLKPLRPLS